MTDNFGGENPPGNFSALPDSAQQDQIPPAQMPPPEPPGRTPPVQQPGQVPPQQPGQMPPVQPGQGPPQQPGPFSAAPGHPQGGMMPYPSSMPVYGEENKKIVAGICALLIGWLGIHKFILGYTGAGIIQIAASFLTCGLASIIPIIEGIIYLTKSDAEFYQTYQVGKRDWF